MFFLQNRSCVCKFSQIRKKSFWKCSYLIYVRQKTKMLTYVTTSFSGEYSKSATLSVSRFLVLLIKSLRTYILFN